MEGEAPVALVGKIEDALEGETPDAIIFAMGLVLGRIVGLFALPEDHDEVVDACVQAIRVGIQESEIKPADRH